MPRRTRACLFATRIVGAIIFAIFLYRTYTFSSPKELAQQESYPLTTRHIHLSSGHGGAWFIPPEWDLGTSVQPTNITHAARLVSEAVDSDPCLRLNYTSIPRIIHQSWKSTIIDEIPAGTLSGIEEWLEYATYKESPRFAYFFWNDDGVSDFVNEFAPEIQPFFDLLPRVVERSDLFRVLVCEGVGGVYTDIDTHPLRPPSTWVQEHDLQPWIAATNQKLFGSDDNSTSPVALILGIEADTEEGTDTFWRMGYTHFLQLTQWTIASAPNHPLLTRFLDDFRSRMQKWLKEFAETSSVDTLSDRERLYPLDPTEVSGPGAITKITKDYLAETAELNWKDLSGLHDGGRSKLVDNVLILPITGFSPGRGRYGNMGSKPFSDPDARIRHDAQGSWRGFNLRVEAGKSCRTLLGLCKDWSKVAK